MLRRLTLCLFLLAPPAAYSQEQQGLELKGDVISVKVKKIIEIEEARSVFRTLPGELSAPKNGAGYWWTVPQGLIASDQGDTLKIVSASKGEYTVKVKVLVVDFQKQTTTNTTYATTFLVGETVPTPVPPLPPSPKPDPEPKPPTPTPASSFRVIWITESAKTLTAQQNSVINAKAVRDYLKAETTPEAGWAGWRSWDQNTVAEFESPNMKALWDAVKPKITSVPCVAIEVNGRAEIVPLPTTPAAAIELFKRYKSGGA